MPNSGYYTGQHSQFPASTRTYLGSMNADLDGSGFFPTTEAERSAMWYRDDNRDPVGITCIEFFFYFSSFDSADHTEHRYFMEGKSRQQTTNSPTDIIKIFYRGAANARDIRIQLRQTNSANASSNNNISVKFDSPNNLNNVLVANRWYHFVLRWSNSNSRWQAYVGSMGLNADGSDGGTVSVLNAFAASDPNNGAYMGFSSSQITSDTKGPIGLFSCNQTDNYSNLKTAFNINGRAAAKTQDVHGINGGIAEVRFWKSTLSNSRSLAEIQAEKTLAVIHETHGNLVHCLRFNEDPPANQDSLPGNYADVGQYEMGLIGNSNDFFQVDPDYSAITINPNSYPYDIEAESEGPPDDPIEYEVSALASGQTTFVDFYGQHWANDVDGNAYYRESIGRDIAVHSQIGVDEMGDGVPVRAAVEDYLYPDLKYFLPGTGIITDDGEADFTLIMPYFNPLSGFYSAFSTIYLFDDNELNNTPSGNPYLYSAAFSSGPYLWVNGDTGQINLAIMVDD